MRDSVIVVVTATAAFVYVCVCEHDSCPFKRIELLSSDFSFGSSFHFSPLHILLRHKSTQREKERKKSCDLTMNLLCCSVPLSSSLLFNAANINTYQLHSRTRAHDALLIEHFSRMYDVRVWILRVKLIVLNVIVCTKRWKGLETGCAKSTYHPKNTFILILTFVILHVYVCVCVSEWVNVLNYQEIFREIKVKVERKRN